MKPSVDDIEFGHDEINQVRQTVIETRDSALAIGRFDYAVPLSYAVALLAELAKRVREEQEIEDLL